MDPIEDPRITEFGLVHEAYRSLHATLERRLDALGLGPLLWHEVLLRLVRSPEGRSTVTELARQVLVTPGSFTRVLDRMEAAGLLDRRPSPASRRTTLVTITSAGRDRVVRSAAASIDCLERHMFAVLDADERATLSSAMRAIRAANT